jgi:hypothetical protein
VVFVSLRGQNKLNFDQNLQELKINEIWWLVELGEEVKSYGEHLSPSSHQ